VQTSCRARIEATSCTVSKVVLFLVLLRAAKAAAKQVSIAIGVVLVEALSVLYSF
jgi:hypothetical protein